MRKLFILILLSFLVLPCFGNSLANFVASQGISSPTWDTIFDPSLNSDSNVLWQEGDDSIFPGEGNYGRLSTSIKSNRLYIISNGGKLINTATTAYKRAMDATRTVPFSVIGAKKMGIFILGATETDSETAGTSIFGTSASISAWGSPIGTQGYGLGNIGTAGRPNSMTAYRAIPAIPLTPGVAFSNIVYASFSDTTLRAQPTLYANGQLPASSGILYITQPGQFEYNTTGLKHVYFHCESIYTTTATIYVSLYE